MTPVEIIKEWLKFSEYDPEKKVHNLFSTSYAYHKICENIKGILEFDPNGVFAALYAKHAFMELMKDGKVSAYDVLSNPHFLEDERAMWALFNSDEMNKVQEDLLSSFDKLVTSIISVKMLGNRDEEAEKAALLGAIEAVTTDLQKCKVDVFKKGSPMSPISYFSTHIHVFNRLSEALLQIETARDGIYLCYINNDGTADGYFGFLIKDPGGAIIFVQERIDEAFPGEHKGRRSSRWSEDKKDSLFPYEFIFKYEKFDYLGYANSYEINRDELAFFSLKPEAYMPLVIAMLMLNSKYTGYDTSTARLKYIDTLLPNSLALPTPGQAELMIPSASAIALAHKEFAIELTTEDVVTGSKAEEFDGKSRDKYPDREWHEFGHFVNPNYSDFYGINDAEMFIRLYGEGFELDTSHLLEANHHLKRLTSAELAETKETPNVEFVGTKFKLDMICYWQGRKQLAEYIKDRIAEEYFAFGGPEKANEWWKNIVLARKEQILKMCVAKVEEKEGVIPECIKVKHQTKAKGYPEHDGSNAFWYAIHPFNTQRADTWGSYTCCECDTKASEIFIFKFEDWKALQSFLGDEKLPKIFIGYNEQSHDVIGNSILSPCDELGSCGTPFEYRQSQWNPRLQDIKDESGRKVHTEKHFCFWIGFSKRTLNNLKKQYK